MAVPVNRLQNLRSLRVANLDGAFSTAFATLVTGSFQVGFVKLLGASDLWIGLLSALPALLGVLQIPGAILGRSYPSYKPYVAIGGGIWRLLYLPMIALPLLALPAQFRLAMLLLAIGVASASVLLVQPIYNEWLSELVPQNSRGWFFSRRNAIATAVGSAVGLGGGYMLDQFRESGREALGLSVTYGLGLFCAAISFGLFMSMKDLPREHPVPANFKTGIAAIRGPFADREFRRVLIFLTAFIMGQGFAGNLYSAYALESLKISFTLLQFFGLVQASGNVAAARFWGFIADKYGNKPTLIIAGLGIATNPIAWMLTTPGNLTQTVVVLTIGHFIMGFFWAGVNLSQFNLLLATSKPEDRANYLGAGLALQSVVSGISPLLGATMMTALRGWMSPIYAYKWIFFTTLFLRFIAVLFVSPVREEGSAKVQRALRDLRSMRPRTVRTMRRLARSTDTAARAEALEEVAAQRIGLASDEVVRSLADPSPEVRRSAAMAISTIGDRSLAAPLLKHIMDHPDLVDEDMIIALGQLGSNEATTLLIQFLQSPKSMLRRAAASALGRIHSEEAVAALIESTQEKDDPDLQRASINALRRLRARDAVEVFSATVLSAFPSVRIAAAEAIAELQIRECLPALHEALDKFKDETASEIAYAICAVGTISELPAILRVAQRSETTLARRRCLLGIARLLDVEREVYKLFLQTGMARDAALLEVIRPVSKKSRKVKAALERYAGGDEKGGLLMLGQAANDPVVREVAEIGLTDSFLVMAVYVAKSFTHTSRQSSARHRSTNQES